MDSSIFATPRLEARPFSYSDMQEIARILTNKEVMHFSLRGPCQSLDEVALYLEKIIHSYMQSGYGLWGLYEKKERIFIGFAGIQDVLVNNKKETELICRLLPAYQKKGLAKEACMAVIEKAFTVYGKESLLAMVSPENRSSIALLRSLGMNLYRKESYEKIDVSLFSIDKLTFTEPSPHSSHHVKKMLAELQRHFPEHKMHIVGSYAIEGLLSQNRLDIATLYHPLHHQFEKVHSKLEGLGFYLQSEDQLYGQKVYYAKGNPDKSLTFFVEDDPSLRRLRLFREWVAHDEKQKKEVNTFKKRCAERFYATPWEYAKEKAYFIKDIDYFIALHKAHSPKQKVLFNRKSSWSVDDIKKAMRANMHRQMSYFATYLPAIALEKKKGVTLVYSDINDDTFNYVLGSPLAEESLFYLIEEINNTFAKRNLPFSWWVDPADSSFNLSKQLIKHNFTLKEKNLGMYLLLATMPKEWAPITLEIVRATTQKRLFDFVSIYQEETQQAKRLYSKIYSSIPPSLVDKHSSVQLFVAYDKEQKPVAIAQIVFFRDTMGIYFLMTKKKEQRKGYASQLLRALLRLGKEKGYHLATLQASDEGRYLFRKFRFEEAGIIEEYIPST